MKPTKKQSQPRIVIGLRRTHLDLVILRPAGDGREASVRTRTVQWRYESTTLASEAGQQELVNALKPLIAEERLTSANISVSLSGDFCVTRVVTGPSDRVRRELAQLEERSALYLLLGTGPKALAASVRQLDARHQHALLTVVNQKLLDAIVHVTGVLGLKVEVIESSLIAMSRALGNMQRDAQQPVMIVHLNERGVELGISHGGQLLLDYRPGGRTGQGDISEVVARHMARLERYCKRYFRFQNAVIDRVFLCGAEEAIQLVRPGFEQHGLHVEALEATEIESAWTFSHSKPTAEASGALGTALLAVGVHTQGDCPNLVTRLKLVNNAALLPFVLRSLWPVAAALLVAASLSMLAVHGRYQLAKTEAAWASTAEGRARVEKLRSEIRRSDRMIEGLQSVAVQLPKPAWHSLIATISQCLPDDVWLERIAVENGQLKLNGVSYSDDGIYEFIGWLKRNPRVTGITLEETGRTAIAGGPVTRFGAMGTISDFTGQNDSTDGEKTLARGDAAASKEQL